MSYSGHSLVGGLTPFQRCSCVFNSMCSNVIPSYHHKWIMDLFILIVRKEREEEKEESICQKEKESKYNKERKWRVIERINHNPTHQILIIWFTGMEWKKKDRKERIKKKKKKIEKEMEVVETERQIEGEGGGGKERERVKKKWRMLILKTYIGSLFLLKKLWYFIK